MSSAFSGAKIAVLGAGQVVTLLRDRKDGIPHAGLWDLPGGGRERGESPFDCALRETWEETGLRFSPADVVWRREYPGETGATWFLVARPGWLVLPRPELGGEGQAVRWMGVEAFLGLGDAVPHLQERLRDYLAESGPAVRAAG